MASSLGKISFSIALTTNLLGQDVLIACIDDLKGLSDVMGILYPKTQIQQCMVHTVYCSIKFLPSMNT
ncbi:transposase [Psychrobacter sp. PAMC 21119]|uniref:transposase n=1 Tax=Psychrobacter sp. PAMC 21119 TaxID=1112209 RepID=UPI0039B40BFB